MSEEEAVTEGAAQKFDVKACRTFLNLLAVDRNEMLTNALGPPLQTAVDFCGLALGRIEALEKVAEAATSYLKAKYPGAQMHKQIKLEQALVAAGYMDGAESRALEGSPE